MIGKTQQKGDFDQLDNQRYIDWRESSSQRQFDQIVKTERSDTTNLSAGGSILNSPINRDLSPSRRIYEPEAASLRPAKLVRVGIEHCRFGLNSDYELECAILVKPSIRIADKRYPIEIRWL